MYTYAFKQLNVSYSTYIHYECHAQIVKFVITVSRFLKTVSFSAVIQVSVQPL